MKSEVTVEDWINMFKEVGLDQTQIKQWHRIFEAANPIGHESFLHWLGLPEKRIEEIRAASR